MEEFQEKAIAHQKRTQRIVSHLPKNILIIPKTLGKIFYVLNTKKTKVELSRRCAFFYISCKTNIAFKENIISTVKHVGANVMVIWGCFAA